MDINSMQGAFAINQLLDVIYPDALNCTEVTDFGYAFLDCTNLQTIPEGLFDNCPEVTTFAGAFNYCTSLQAIPEGLFEKSTEVTDFSNVFLDCANLIIVPEGLFHYNTKVTDFGGAFQGTAITEIPAYTFGTEETNVNFTNTFYDCKSLTTVKSNAFNCPNH